MSLYTLLRQSLWGLFGAIGLPAGVLFLIIRIVQLFRDRLVLSIWIGASQE